MTQDTGWAAGTPEGGKRGPGLKAAGLATAVLLAAGGGAAFGLHGQTVAAERPTHPPAVITTTTTFPPASSTTTTSLPAPKIHTTDALVPYGTCSQVLGGIKAEALSEVGPYGLPNDQPRRFGGVAGGGVALAAGGTSSAAPAPEAAASNGSASSGSSAGSGSGTPSGSAGADSSAPSSPSYSATNNQEAGVDEPDLTKTDGKLLLVLRHNPMGLEVTDVSGATPHLDGFLALSQMDYSSELFLDGTYAIVLGSTQWATPQTSSSASQPQPEQSATEALVISLADPAHPSVVRTFTLQGDEVGARLVGGQVLVVLRNQPYLPWSYPPDGGTASQSEATIANQDLIRRSSLADWLPSTTVSPGGRRQVSSCAAVLHTQVASGLDTVSVASLNPSQSQTTPEVTVVGEADTVYAATDTLYVATNPWTVQMEELAPAPGPGVTPPSLTTDIHAFDMSDPTRPSYLGSGTVPGTLIGQYALSEYAGDLRVATTVGLPTPPPREGTAPSQPSNNIVTVLARKNNALAQVGSVGGLGQGEKIYGVRFVGPIGYVVTFRQTDPLYVVDLSDPSAPKVDGELPLTGYSSFLQPLSGSLLLGVGSSVDSNIRVTGLQLSVFDVSNPANPVLRSKIELDGASSDAQSDPHALLWWPSSRLVAMPVSIDNYDQPAPANSASSSGGDSRAPFNGVIVWHVGNDGTLTEVARLSQPQPQAQNPPCDNCAQPSGGAMTPAGGGAMYYPAGGEGIERAMVIGDNLFTVSDAGVMANSMSNWSRVAWLAFTGS